MTTPSEQIADSTIGRLRTNGIPAQVESALRKAISTGHSKGAIETAIVSWVKADEEAMQVDPAEDGDAAAESAS